MNTNYYKTKADLAWGMAIHAGRRCAMCGYGGQLQAHHIISRANKAARHAVENGILLCATCHTRAHQNKRSFMDWLKGNRPDQWRWVTAHKWETKKPDYRQAYRSLTNEIEAAAN